MRILINSEPVNRDLLDIKRENIIKALGVPENKADEYLVRMIDELKAYCLALCTPAAAVTIFEIQDFSRSLHNLTVGGVTFNLNKMVASALDKSTYLAVFAGTCGEKTGQYSDQLIKDGYPLEGLIVDLIGSEIAEGVAEYIHFRVKSEMTATGVSNRYSPGYCNWHVSDQHKLFGLLGENNCGIKLTGSSLMLPIKSVSGIIGIGDEVVNRGYACKWCDADHCLFRDKK